MDEMPGNLDNHPTPVSGLDRRQLLRAGAWAAPVVLIAAATPAAAASTNPPVPIDINYATVIYKWLPPNPAVASDLELWTAIRVTATDPDPGRDVSQLLLTFFISATDGFYDAMKSSVPVFVQPPTMPWTFLGVIGSGGNITFVLRWTGTLNTFSALATGDVAFRVSAAPDVDLRRFAPIAWTLTASSPDSTTTSQNGGVSTDFDPPRPGIATLSVPATASATDVEITGNDVSVHVSGTVSEAAVVTAFILVEATAGSTNGSWLEEVDGSTDGTRPRGITVDALPGQPNIFAFPTYQGVAGSSYDFLIIYNWGPDNEFQKATTGSFTIAP